jgi:DNA/RNA endonuclease G (NUC1)
LTSFCTIDGNAQSEYKQQTNFGMDSRIHGECLLQRDEYMTRGKARRHVGCDSDYKDFSREEEGDTSKRGTTT